MANKMYILNIEFDEETEEIEYIQEEIIEPGEDVNSEVLTCLTEEGEYWNKESIDLLRKFYTGEIGES